MSASILFKQVVLGGVLFFLIHHYLICMVDFVENGACSLGNVDFQVDNSIAVQREIRRSV